MAGKRVASRSRVWHGSGWRAVSRLNPIGPNKEICLELQDHSLVTRSAVKFFGSSSYIDAQAQAARISDQFIQQNSAVLRLMGIEIRRDYDGSDVLLKIRSHGSVGAVPLLSPLTARYDLGLVVQPRFPWAGIGPMLAEMGWMVSPTPLRLPLLKRSERKVPLWVVSFMVLSRLKALLDGLDRRFEVATETLSAPRGRVEWTDYVTKSISRGQFMSIPCTFSDLRDDRQLKGAIRFAIEKQLRSLQTQSEQGAFVHRLIAFAESLLLRVTGACARRPTVSEMQAWFRRPLRSDVFLEGIQALDWTVEERGLAGLSDLEVIPWAMPMERFFEAWVEKIFRGIARHGGGVLKAGRCRETVAPLVWDPPYLGSQRSLVPDLILEREDITVIVDAKYKRHWEELQHGHWGDMTDEVREDHRSDLLQVLAYANLAKAREVICCLVYPCSPSTWESLIRRGRLFHRAELPSRERRIRVWLTAVPMSADAERVAAPINRELRQATGL